MKSLKHSWLLVFLSLSCIHAKAEELLQNPKQVWADYDSHKGDFKEEIVKEETKEGVYYRESYISAFVRGEEIRVYCLYKVKEGAQKAPARF